MYELLLHIFSNLFSASAYTNFLNFNIFSIFDKKADVPFKAKGRLTILRQALRDLHQGDLQTARTRLARMR